MLDTETENGDADYDDNDADTEMEDYNPFPGIKKNYRRRNYMLGHMARMNFRRQKYRNNDGLLTKDVRRERYFLHIMQFIPGNNVSKIHILKQLW